MRVNFASYDDVPALGGQGVMLDGMRRALAARGVEVSTVSGRGAHAVRYPAVLRRAPLDFSLHLNRHRELLERSDPDVVHALGGPGGVLLIRRLRLPLIYTANHTYRQAHRRGRPKRMLAPLEARSYEHASMVCAVSRSTAASLRQMGIAAARIEVVMPGVDIPDTPAAPREQSTVLFVGRLEPEKGVLDAVIVMRRLVADGDATAGVIVGSGSLERAVTGATATDPRIRMLGAVSLSDLRTHYAQAAVLLMPSRYEGLGLVALEAQAAATPVAGYDVDGLREAVGDEGLLVEPGDREALRAAARSLLRDGRRREELGARAQMRMREQHAWPVVASRLIEIYEAARAR